VVSAYAHTDTDAFEHTDTNAHADGYAHAICHADRNRYSHPLADAHTQSDTDHERHTRSYGHTRAGHADTNGYACFQPAYAYIYSYANSYANTARRKADGYANRDAHTHKYTCYAVKGPSWIALSSFSKPLPKPLVPLDASKP
jgi:hypothetical protein